MPQLPERLSLIHIFEPQAVDEPGTLRVGGGNRLHFGGAHSAAGIRDVTVEDVKAAEQLDCAIKLIARCV